MAKTTALAYKLGEMSARIRELREIQGLTVYEMAKQTAVSVEEYQRCESGAEDLNFAFIYRCALALGVDVNDIIEGTSPNLSAYTVTRAGQGQQISSAHGMEYFNLAPAFKNKIAEPLYVRAAYTPEAERADIELTTHEGQELDIVIEGSLKVQVGEHTEVLGPGDSIYYDSSTPHGLIAVDGRDCIFYAIVLNPTGEAIPEISEHAAAHHAKPVAAAERAPEVERVWNKFIIPTEAPDGSLKAIAFRNEDTFNYAYDVVDAIAAKQPDKLAMLHISRDHEERRISFYEVSRQSNRVANYLKSLGVKKGDRVMLILKRNYQFWYAMMGLCKLGAVAIPATDQLLAHDIEYRIKAAGVTAIICTANSNVASEVEIAEQSCETPLVKLLTCGSRAGWRDFDDEFTMYSSHFDRTPDTACGNEPMLMYFTSGTTGYPKIARHNFKYPLGHFITAKYWHCVDPDGLHLTISDTGWAKAMWGKLYGQWLCEAAVFVYDFDRFHAADILPMFAKYGITTFCAPPTMYRFMIKEDLSCFDLSSIKHATIAGEALNPEVFHQFKRATGLSLMEGFGQSESTVMIGNLIGMTPKIGSMGKPVPLYDIILADSDGKPVPVGQTGEICVRTNPGETCGLFTGYYMNDEKTAEVWHDGLYHTGDTAWQDEDGYFWYVGRVDDVIKSSGYRIGPFEIESVIMELPYVLECGVSAAPDEVRGQVVKASIVLVKGTEPTEALKKEIQTYVKQHTAPYKYPRIVVFRDELPKTVSGKIIRNKL